MTIEQMKEVENAQTKYIVNFLTKEIKTDSHLAECIANTKLTIIDCMKYIKDEVKKKAIDNMAMIEDAEVYGLAKHFYLEHESFEDPKNALEQNMGKRMGAEGVEIPKVPQPPKQVKEPEVKVKAVKKTKAEIKEEALNNLYGGGLFG